MGPPRFFDSLEVSVRKRRKGGDIQSRKCPVKAPPNHYRASFSRCSLTIRAATGRRARSIDSNADSKKRRGITRACPDATLTLPPRRIHQLYSGINGAGFMRNHFVPDGHYSSLHKYQWASLSLPNRATMRYKMERGGDARRLTGVCFFAGPNSQRIANLARNSTVNAN